MTHHLVSPEQIAERQQLVLRRGLAQWPQETPGETAQVSAFAQWLGSLASSTVLAHPHFPLFMPVDADFSPRMACYFSLGDYEQADLQLIDQLIQAGDRVVECGGGAGVTGSLAGMRSGRAVTVVEPNTQIHGQIQATFAANGQQLELIDAAVVADSYPLNSIELGFYPEYWWSSSLAPALADRRESVPVLRLGDLLARLQPSVLILDIEGGELGLFPTSLPDQLRLLMVEIHTPDIGELATVELVNSILAQGFVLRRLLAQTWVFERSN